MREPLSHQLWPHVRVGLWVKSRLLVTWLQLSSLNASAWTGVYHFGWYFCSNVSLGKSAQNNLLGHLECFKALVCLWSCTSVYVYANMYKQIGICFKHLRAVLYPPAKFDMSKVILPVFFFLQWRKDVRLLGLLCTLELKQQSQTVWWGKLQEQNHWEDPEPTEQKIRTVLGKFWLVFFVLFSDFLLVERSNNWQNNHQIYS